MPKIIRNKALLPAGFSDILYPKSQKQFVIVEKILEFFSNYSYLRVSPPLVEFEETLLSEGPGFVLKENSFRIMDPITKKMMAIRSDMTTQISRISSTRMSHYPRPLRLSYSGDVLRVKSTTLNMDRQITQVGAEIIGKISDALESEIILISLKTLNSLKIKNLSIDLNFPKLRNKLLNKCPKYLLPKVTQAIERKDLIFLKKNNFPNKVDILNLMENFGYFDSRSSYLKKLTKINQKNKSIINLIKIAEKIKKNFVDINIIIDPLESNPFNYHDGMTFTVFSKSIRGGIAKGGTYKTIAGEKATGVSIYTELIKNTPELLLKKNHLVINSIDFNDAEKYISKGFQIIFSEELNENNYNKIAKKMNCNYVLINKNLIKIE